MGAEADNRTALVDRWVVRNRSLLGTLVPELVLFAGMLAFVAGMVNIVTPFVRGSGTAFTWLIACGIFPGLLGALPTVFSVRNIVLQSDGTFCFKSLVREHSVRGESVTSIVGLPLLMDTWRIYPVVVTTSDHRFLVVRQLERASELEQSLRRANPAMRVVSI